MTEFPSQAEVNHWREAIIEDEWIPKYELSRMGKHDPVHFAHLVRALLADPSPERRSNQRAYRSNKA